MSQSQSPQLGGVKALSGLAFSSCCFWHHMRSFCNVIGFSMVGKGDAMDMSIAYLGSCDTASFYWAGLWLHGQATKEATSCLRQ